MLELASFMRKGQEGHLFSGIFISVNPDCKTVPSDQSKDYTGFLEGFQSGKFNYLQKNLVLLLIKSCSFCLCSSSHFYFHASKRSKFLLDIVKSYKIFNLKKHIKGLNVAGMYYLQPCKTLV